MIKQLYKPYIIIFGSRSEDWTRKKISRIKQNWFVLI